jgi:predicted transcriptional regulator
MSPSLITITQAPAVAPNIIRRHVSNNPNPALAPEPPKDTRLDAMREAEKEDIKVFKDVSVQQILESKKNPAVATVHKTDTVYSAIKKMNAMKVGALVVVENDSPVGVISERDYLNKVILKGHSSKDITVSGISLPLFALPIPANKNKIILFFFLFLFFIYFF